jgi:hypothetical protein
MTVFREFPPFPWNQGASLLSMQGSVPDNYHRNQGRSASGNPTQIWNSDQGAQFTLQRIFWRP